MSDKYYSNPNASLRDVRSRTTSGPVNYSHPPSHHHTRSMSLYPSGGHPRAPVPLFRPHTSNSNSRPREDIKILPPQRSMTPSTAGYAKSRSAPVHRSRTSSVVAPSPRRAYDSPDSPHSDEWIMKYGPPQAIKLSNSHPRSRYDVPTRAELSGSGYRPHPSSKPSRQPVIGSPSSHMSQLTKENTIANSHSRTFARGVVDDSGWSVIDEDDEWEKEQQRAAYRRGRASSQSSGSPPLTFSRSRTTSSSSRSGYYPPPSQKVPVSLNPHTDRRTRGLTTSLKGPEKPGPPPAHSSGFSSTKRHFFSRLFRTGSDKSVPVAHSPPSNRLHRRHSISDSRR